MTTPMRSLFGFMRPYRGRLVLSLASSTANKILDLMPPLLVAWVIDSVGGNAPKWIIQITGSNDPWRLAILLSSLAVIIFALESLFQWGYQYGFQTLSQLLQHDLRLKTYAHLQERETAFFEDQRLGNTMSILNDDVNQLERFLNSSFNEIVQMGVLVLFAGAVMMLTSLPLATFALIPLPLIVIGSLYYQRRISPKYLRIRQAVGSLSSRLENNISGIAVIKSFTAESFEYQRVEAASQDYLNANLAAIRVNTLYVPIIRMGIAFGFAGVLLLGSYWILNGATFLSLGQLVLFSMMIQRLLWPFTRLGSVIDEYARAKASAERIFGLLATKSKIQNPKDPKTVSFTGAISVQNLVFSYREDQAPILNGLDFTIKANETVGIAGITGSGKSSIIKCLLRLYDAQSGDILFDNISIRSLSLNSLRSQIALVSQDIYLFHGSIFENIAYGIESAQMDDVVKAAKLAELDEFIMSCPDQYHSLVGEKGIKLSGGQRQRLSIARAILKNAPIMIFDEATSSVDTETEREIQSNINRLAQGKTALIIAHRLSTIRHADRILVIDKGKILEEGHHDDLIKQKGTYADLWNIQTGSLE